MSRQPDSVSQPNLAAILQTLSSYSRIESGSESTARNVNRSIADPTYASHQGQNVKGHVVEDEDDDYDPESICITDVVTNVASHTLRASSNTNVAVHKDAGQVAPLTRPLPSEDSQKITTWPAALRFTTKLLHESPAVEQRIKSLIKGQHRNEQQWWSGREELIRAQKARIEGRAQIQEVLKSIGAPISGSSNPAQDEKQRTLDETNELRAYDFKVHLLMGRAAREQEKDLAIMAIPFFGLPDKSKACFSVGQLQNLQNKMLQFLEEFVKD